MKKIISMILALAMAAALAGCGGGQELPEAGQSSQAAQAVVQTNADADQTQGEPDATQPDAAPGEITSIDGLQAFYGGIVDAMSKIITDLQDKHNEGAEFTDMVNLWYMPFSELRYVDTVYFDDDADLAGIQTALRYLGNEDAEVTADGNSYIITYTNKDYFTEETYAFREVISCDLSTLGLSILEYHDGELIYFTEFQGLGNDRYAMSTEFERAIVTYKDGEVTAFKHAENLHDTDYDTNEYTEDSYIFTYDQGKIFGNTSLDDSWVTAADSTGKLHYLYDYNGETCRITGLKSDYDWNSGKTVYEPGYDVTLP